MSGGPVHAMAGSTVLQRSPIDLGPHTDWRSQPDWRDHTRRIEPVSLKTLLGLRTHDREALYRNGDYAYLDELTEKIRSEGYDPRHPVTLRYDPYWDSAYLWDGNHRVAVAKRLGLESLPTQMIMAQRRFPKSEGRRLGRGQLILPDQNEYMPASLPPSWAGFRRRGGPAHASDGVFAGVKNARLLHRYTPQGYSSHIPDVAPTKTMSSAIDSIRAIGNHEEHLAFDGSGNLYGHSIGEATNVDPERITGRPWWNRLPSRYSTGHEWLFGDKGFEKHEYTRLDLEGLVGIHNHPDVHPGQVWRPSSGDIASMFAANMREAWVVTPNHTTIMRLPPSAPAADPGLVGQDMLTIFKNQFPHTKMFDNDVVADFINSRRINLDSRFWTNTLDQMADMYGFGWEHYFHPRMGRGRQLPLGLRSGGPVRAWRGVTARAYYDTLANTGGTFPVTNIPVPTSGHAVGIAKMLGLETIYADKDDPVAFMRAFHKMRRAGAPFVGTWVDPETNLINVDPSTVIANKRAADMVARFGGEKAGFDIGKFNRTGDADAATWYTDPARRARLSMEKALRIIHGKRRFAMGGPVHAGTGLTDITGIEGNFRKWMDAATPEQFESGSNWYQEWGAKLREAAERLQYEPRLLTSVAAALSPRNGWPGNFHDAVKYAEAARANLSMPTASTFRTNQLKAWNILLDQSTHHLKGLKVTPFGDALLGDPNAKPQDIWMKRAALDDLSIPSAGGSPSVRQRREMDRVIDLLAQERNLEPRQVQAIIWTAVRERGLANRTKHARMRASGGPVLQGAASMGVMELMKQWATDPYMAMMTWQAIRDKQHRRRGGPAHASDGLVDVSGGPLALNSGWLPVMEDNLEYHPRAHEIVRAAQKLNAIAPMVMKGVALGIAPLEESMNRNGAAAHYSNREAKINLDPEYLTYSSAEALHNTIIHEGGHAIQDAIMHLGFNQGSKIDWQLARHLTSDFDRLSLSGGPISNYPLERVEDVYTNLKDKGKYSTPENVLTAMSSGLHENFADTLAAMSRTWESKSFKRPFMHQIKINQGYGSWWPEEAYEAGSGRLLPDIKQWLDMEFGSYKYQPPFGNSGLQMNLGEWNLNRNDPRPFGWRERELKSHMARILHAMPRRAAGGETDPWKGMYIVGEIGPELFVPNRMRHVVPKWVEDQIPHAANGIQVIGKKRNELFMPPEDGLIIPNRLMDKVPHAAGGRRIGDWARGFAERLGFGADGWPSISPSTAGYSVEDRGIRGPFGRYVSRSDYRDVSEAEGGPRLLGPGRTRGRANPIGDMGPISLGSPSVTAQTVTVNAAGATTVETKAASGASGSKAQSDIEKMVGNFRDQGFDEADIKTALKQYKFTDSEIKSAMLGETPTSEDPMEIWRKHQAGIDENADANEAFSDAVMGFKNPSTMKLISGRTPRGNIANTLSMKIGGQGKMLELQQVQQQQIRDINRLGKANPEFKKSFTEYSDMMNRLALSHTKAGRAEGHRTEEIEKEIHAFRNGSKTREDVIKWHERMTHTANKLNPGLGALTKNLAVVIGSTAMYGMAMTLANTALEMGASAAEKQIDAMTGWRSTYTTVTSDLAKATQQLHGNIGAAMAQAGVTANLSGSMMDYVKSSLTSGVVAKAGANAQGETNQLARAALAARQGKVPTGLNEGYGGVFGSSFLGSEMGGGKGFMENVQAMFSGNRESGLPDALSLATNFLGNTDYRNLVLDKANKQGDVMGGIGNFLGRTGDALRKDGYGTGGWANAAVSLADFFGKNPNDAAYSGPYNPKAGLSKVQQDANEVGLKDLNDAAARGAEAMNSLTKVTWRYARSPEEEKKAIDAAIASGNTFAATLAKTSHIVMDVNKKLATAANMTQAEEQTARGKTIASPDVWAGLQVNALKAQLQASALSTQRQMSLGIPWGVTQQLLMNPLQKPGSGIIPGASSGRPNVMATGVSAPVGANITSMLRGMSSDQSILQAYSAQGWTAQLKNIRENIPGEFAPEFDKGPRFEKVGPVEKQFMGLKSSVETTSASIAQLTSDMNELNVAAATASWDNQIRLARRALSDALGVVRGFTGKGAAGSEFGRIQGQQQALSFQLQERQIATSMALARFQAPGETGEERYARQKEKIYEASVQNKQLKLSERSFAISMERAVTDTNAALGVMKKARDAEINALTSQAAIALAQQKMAVEFGKIAAIADEADKNWGTLTGAALQGINDFTGGLDKGVTAIYKALGFSVTKDPKTGVNRFVAGDTAVPGMEGETGPTVNPGQFKYLSDRKLTRATGGTGASGGSFAPGMFGTFGTPTSITIGEAGTETVAVLRNPRTMDLSTAMPSSGGGWGSPSVTVNINGPVVRDAADIETLASMVATKVEQRMARRGQLTGLRGPAY